jgi:hypothetical protein
MSELTQAAMRDALQGLVEELMKKHMPHAGSLIPQIDLIESTWDPAGQRITITANVTPIPLQPPERSIAESVRIFVGGKQVFPHEGEARCLREGAGIEFEMPMVELEET